MVSRDDIDLAQTSWGAGVVSIGAANSWEEAHSLATKLVTELYNKQDQGFVFCPTKASVDPFRRDIAGAISYFVGGNQDYSEDSGFALEPWIGVRFENEGVILRENNAITMGHYFFKKSDGTELMVEFTFCYTKTEDGSLMVELHHSSLPFAPK